MKRLIVSLLVLAAAAGANAQEAFKHIAVGVEAGTTGAGVQLALPVISDHLTLKVGYDFANIPYNANTDVDISKLNSTIKDANAKLQELKVDDRITERFDSRMEIGVAAKANLGAAKALLEYYPFESSSLHIVAGAYFGASDFVTADISASESFVNDYKAFKTEVEKLKNKYSEVNDYVKNIDDIKEVNINGETWRADDNLRMNAAIEVAKVRPYLGIGLGRSVPEGRVSFKLDLGAWFHGTPALTSASKVTYNANATNLNLDLSVFEKLSIWPNISAGVAVKLF